jgi:hypothetical protein
VLYGFFDERYRYEKNKKERFLAAACIALLQRRYTAKAQEEIKTRLRNGKASFLERLDPLLVSLDGFATIGTAKLDSQVLRFGARDRGSGSERANFYG